MRPDRRRRFAHGIAVRVRARERARGKHRHGQGGRHLRRGQHRRATGRGRHRPGPRRDHPPSPGGQGREGYRAAGELRGRQRADLRHHLEGSAIGRPGESAHRVDGQRGRLRRVLHLLRSRHNHGGTGFFVEYHYNPNIPNRNYFNALQRKEAIDYAVQVAQNRGDTESVPHLLNTQYNIEVLDPTAVHRDPMKDHGEGDSFLNMLDGLCAASNSTGEAAALVMCVSTAEIKKKGE